MYYLYIHINRSYAYISIHNYLVLLLQNKSIVRCDEGDIFRLPLSFLIDDE